VFGDYIDVYDILQSKEDKATVPIYYEARLAKIDLKPEERPKIDPNFEEVTEGAEESSKESLRRKWAQLEAMVGTDKRIALVTEDLVKHWEARYGAMEGKAMVVCMSRRICVELYRAIQKLRPDWHHDDDDNGVMKIVMSGSASDKLDWQKHIRNKKRIEELAKAFKNPKRSFRCSSWGRSESTCFSKLRLVAAGNHGHVHDSRQSGEQFGQPGIERCFAFGERAIQIE
jgi:type I restriction enzyme R subunit